MLSLCVCVFVSGCRKTDSIHIPKSDPNARTIQYLHPIRPVVERKWCRSTCGTVLSPRVAGIWIHEPLGSLDCSIILVDVYHFVIVDVNFLLSRLLVKETRC